MRLRARSWHPCSGGLNASARCAENRAGGGQAEYHSIMCSTPVQRITRAIDELATQTDAARSGAGDSGQVVTRLAELWALLAELDPEVAKRLPTYEA